MKGGIKLTSAILFFFIGIKRFDENKTYQLAIKERILIYLPSKMLANVLYKQPQVVYESSIPQLIISLRLYSYNNNNIFYNKEYLQLFYTYSSINNSYHI